ncbi:BlaI/MecI/CopY family transcriptional regulator [Brevundimonas staleyi]|uniref:BlaI/MecI/CopY family transcriptional regulator n=1 Tax=Brevundimonas staleyi TaxID=74326 RepID=A0ABW0FS80_9CAUL
MSDIAPPTDAELDILKCFWRDGDLSASEVRARIADSLGWTSSTTRTVLERMRAKGLIDRREAHGIAVYSAVQPKVAVIGGLMRRLSAVLEMAGPLPASAFSGSALLDPADIEALEAALGETSEEDKAR